MPELPEVETVCRGLKPALVGQEIVKADVRRKDLRRPFPRGLKACLESSRIAGVGRRAKYILVHLDNGFVLVIHLGMSGRIVFQPHSYKPQPHDHFILHLSGGQQVVLNDPRRFGLVDLVPAAELDSHQLFAHLGPEPLSDCFSGPVLAAALQGRKTAIKLAIMDQHIVVGVGNIYASEALFMAGIDPAMPAGEVETKKVEALAAAIKKVLQQAIRAGGSTLRDHRQTNGERGYFQHHFMVYDQEGAPCPRCRRAGRKKARIARIIQGGRSSFYCPRCQI
ncbi:MAG: bifunctional DNA-formamidopyrimidine glycosylase/DNA-(apurinic or apyrimidinic site) lyase [Micavibrio aeruginosavorus]|uniref:Formamidopyrimidine-DNA glycosylase n=1 Tax=Micavibrio aeruginosavorus TaxID=349221 RepID=A0A7T5R345_9BACT|nr:MAG: bifunctional DNA-formamidopyrimidine glycosylase/DNA-(apurinic or apyrimidinic site) lyase [Micavibrio aeruginosavorus]